MSKVKRKAKVKLLPFDAARYLNDDAAIAEYMTAVLETGDFPTIRGSEEPRRRRPNRCVRQP